MLLVLLTACAGSARADYAQEVRLDKPLAWWRFDDQASASGAVARDQMGVHLGTYHGGVAVEIGVVTLLYLDRALAARAQARGAAGLTRAEVRDAVVEGALLRLRPVTMTKLAIVAALLPILLGTGAGSETMQRIAAPMVGGMLSVAVLTLLVIPAAYLVWRSRGLVR